MNPVRVKIFHRYYPQTMIFRQVNDLAPLKMLPTSVIPKSSKNDFTISYVRNVRLSFLTGLTG